MRISSGIIRWGTALLFCSMLVIQLSAETKPALRQVGTAKVDVTPDYPIRLNGYLGRNVEATNAAKRIYAKALAIGSEKEGPAIFITLDNCIVPLAMRQELVQRLQKKAHID